MLEAELSNERTILDYLNEDCWRAVLQYVPAQDLIRTESASRRWQAMVLTYLQGIHINIVKDDWRKEINPFNTFTLKPSEYKSFEIWTKKLGSSVASFECDNLENLAMVKENCPNLRALQLSSIECTDSEMRQHKYNLQDSFKFLQRVSFYLCVVTDETVSQFIADKALEKLEFRFCPCLLGFCFSSINASKLKSLVIVSCNLNFTAHSVGTCLSELTELKVACVELEIHYDVQLELPKMAKLERLELSSRVNFFDFSETLGQLPRLKHLGVSYDLDPEELEELLQGCRALRSLELLKWERNACLVELICRHGARLTSLRLEWFYGARDDDVVELVRECPELESLRIGSATHLTRALPARAAAARAQGAGRRLRLDLSRTNLADIYHEDLKSQHSGEYEEIEMKTKYETLIVVFEKTVNEYEIEIEKFENALGLGYLDGVRGCYDCNV
ncbi:uncharacterized protein LOC134790949 [Cydia splendana]|uniref:uncharacterized protein LOC134790949 n=1 Tax=Cydia splendana TaxID=1100963 RepID=UPI0028F4AFE6